MKLIRLMFNGERRDGRLYGLYENSHTKTYYTIQKVEE